MAITKYDLDINKQAIIKPVVILRQGDHDIDTMQVSLSVANEPMDLTGATVTFMGNTANGRQIIDDAHVKIIDAKGGVFEYVFPSQAASDIGEYKVAYFSIILANGQSSTMDFRVQVLSGVDISAPVASEYITHYDTMVTALNSAYDSATHETNEKMASTVSSLATSAATVLDSALARVNTVNSTANSASSAASNAVSMASSVAGTVTSQASYINSVASSAASSVSSVAAGVVNKLNNISVGGRNYILNSKFSTAVDVPVLKQSVDPSFYSDKQVTASVYVKYDNVKTMVPGKGPFTRVVFAVSFMDASGTMRYLDAAKYITSIGESFAGRVSQTMDLSGFNVASMPTVAVFIQNFTADYVEASNPKLEIGNIATDWTPAPEDVDNKIDNISVGGRNLLLDTGRSFTGIGNGSVNGNFNAQGGMYLLTGGKKVSDLYNQYGSSGYLTLSFDWVASGSTISGSFNPQWNANPWEGGLSVVVNPSNTNTYGHYEYTVPLKTSGYSSGWATGIQFRQDNLQGNITIKNVKLEAGNVATDWTPAPEDMASATGRGKILDGADLNNYTEPYKYVIEGATNIANYPSGANVWAILEVDKINSATFTQKITDTDNRVFLRTYAGARPVWSAWIQLSNDDNVLHKTGNETAAGDKTFTGKVAVSGTLDAVQKVYSRTIGSTNDLLINYTRVGNLVTGRYNVKFGGTFPLGANDGFKAPSAYPVNVISYNANAWFMPDNTFHADTGSTGNFMFITNDPLPSN